ncbi:OLC1v1013665C1 [Oldenlandia corymbosa var. corymbosa]|uniref:OLC1v1013665C1 n=1 Tax=Oldenlandia corymbosa var. corymbosa TaxID=529605 RepID=A0AAV1DYW1_OLDCO|nr:OLC1v1013665C1 [Oldenlandia corymbosa var. corymbosa]
MGFFSPVLDTLTLIKNLWSSGFDPVNFIQNSLNTFLPRLSLYALFAALPPYLAYKFIRFIITPLLYKENLSGKIVLIAGASSGIGEHLAYEYARRGSCLVIGARREKIIPVTADVSKVEDCQRLVETAIQHFGRLDHLVNVAGIAPLGLLEELDVVSNFTPSMDINFWGRIVQIASSASWLHVPRFSFYCASKAAVVSFFETLRVEIGSDVGITVVNPGVIESEMTKGKFLMTDGEVRVDQEMRDVQTSVIPVTPVGSCAKAIVDSASRGDRYLTTPSWMRSAFPYRVFSPEILERVNRWFLLPPPGRPATEALSKTVLDISGLKEVLYPPSLLSPDIKVG